MDKEIEIELTINQKTEYHKIEVDANCNDEDIENEVVEYVCNLLGVVWDYAK